MLAVGLLMASSAFSVQVYVTKSKGGLFGYKNVEQTTMNNGQVFLNCTHPGWTRCRYTSGAKISYLNTSFEISVETLNKIDETVTKSVTESNMKGKFIFDNTFFISYSYKENSDVLEYEIFLIEEAKDKGLI